MAEDPDGNDTLRKQARLAARAQRFNNVLPGNRYKELEAARIKQREEFIKQGLITSGQTELDAAIDLRGTCEGMCNEYEIEFREFTKEIHPFEATPNRRMDHAKAVAAYTRSDAGAGHGAAAILPSDLRTPQALVRTLDYLISEILPKQPAPNPNAVNPPPPTARRALGYTAGFIRDRTRAIRKEFAIQSSWGHEEAISCFERIARWHILCLRELQEETGSNTDMHIDSAELGRAFTSLRQHYNDRREESGLDMPCPNEPEFRAYMLIYDLNSKSVSIPISELPAVILDHPLVQLAWQFRQAAQRNFDTQKEGSKLNAELGANLINRFVRLLKQPQVPFLFSCLVEVRLREMRRSAIRALTRTYPRLKLDPIRYNESGEVIERRMLLLPTLDKIIGAEEQEDDEPAWDDVIPVSKNPEDEGVAVVERFGIEVYREEKPIGALINLGAPYNDNKDAPFTRRWKFITEKRGQTPYADIVNGKSGVAMDGRGAAAPVTPSTWKPPAVVKPPQPAPTFAPPKPQPPATNGVSAFSNGTSAFGGGGGGGNAFSNDTSAFSGGAFKPASAFGSGGAFNAASAFGPSAAKPAGSAFAATSTSAFDSASAFKTTPKPTPPATPGPPIPSFFDAGPKKDALEPSTTPKGPPPPSVFPSFAQKATESKTPTTAPKRVSFFDTPAEAGPSKLPSTTPLAPPSAIPSFFPSASTTPARPPPPPFSITPSAPIPSAKPPSPKKASPPRPPPEPPRMKVPRTLMRSVPARLRDKMIAEVIDGIISSAEPDLRKMIDQLEAAQQYAKSKELRQQMIERFAGLMVDSLLSEHIAAIAQDVYAQECRVRNLVRRIARHWKTWTAERVEFRAARKRERDANYARLSGMGLARSVAAFDSSSQPGFRMSTASLTSVRTSQTPIDEMEVILELHETERSKEKLWESSSFLRTLANHISRLVRPTEDDPNPVWETVLLTAEHSGSGVPAEARAWLEDKFLPDHGDTLRHRSVTFKCSVDDVRGEIPGSADTGLVIFEAPLETVNSLESSLNVDDAADRLEAISGRFQQGSRYKPSLLLVTWTDESLDDLVNRLRIAHNLSEFQRVQVLSLEDAEDLDERFAEVLRELVPSDPRLTQVALHLRDIIASLEPVWLDLLYFARQAQLHFPNSPRLAAEIITLALTPFYRFAETVDDALEGLPVSDLSTYEPPPLPRLIIPPSSRDNLEDVASDVATFLSAPTLANVSEIALIRAPLRQCATNGRPLPIINVLEAVASYVFGALTTQCLRLDQWLLPPHPEHAAMKLAEKIISSLKADFAAAADGIARARSETEFATASATPLPSSTESTPVSTPQPQIKSHGVKRSIDETSSSTPESKAAKSARLQRILADAQATINKISRMDEEAGFAL